MPSRLLVPLLYLPALFFEALVRTRNLIYTAGFLPVERLPRPVISIGNLTLGGAGKTPFAIYAATTLLRMGVTPALLSRGYGRLSDRDLLIVPPGKDENISPLAIGDEPALIKRHVPGIWLGIGARRDLAGQKIAKQDRRVVFLLDDGFQHRRLHRDMDILIIDRTQPLERNHPMPHGTLREPLSSLGRAQVIVINGTCSPQSPDALEIFLRRRNPQAPILQCSQTIDLLTPYQEWKTSPVPLPAATEGPKAFLVAALGNPERFRRDLAAKGIAITGRRFFRDHYQLRPKDWIACTVQAKARSSDVIITTEKDAVKISEAPDFPLWVAVQATRMEDPIRFERLIGAVVRETR